ncbi:MAG: arabinan endo-1,5-alpha-L-arabinosidase [Anaerolineae bacterium]|nr:arabinan endo-1,5-alpha-L-arabinosidase [Anaerolineae bacterium]
MSTPYTRRKFLQTGLTLGAGLGLGLAGRRPPFLRAAHAPKGAGLMGQDLTGRIALVHDPAIIKAGEMYYLFCTGAGIYVRQSPDLIDWQMASPAAVFPTVPSWTWEPIPNVRDLWAPDISFFNDRYHLYYSASTFGSNRSAIGLATNATLDPESEDFEWVDHGPVIESFLEDRYNCIDPNVILDEEGVPWMSFGSFWSGIKMRRLDYDTGMLSAEDDTLYNLAYRSTNSGAVEAPFIIRKGDYYYLFVSFDFCCRGADSTYRVMVGRAEEVIGPYYDREGVSLLSGGGTQVTFATDRWRGPGHNSILQEEDQDYIVYHAYDANSNGTATLRIDPLVWDEDGWPSIPEAEETDESDS